MKTDLAITQQSFDELLTWLDPDRETAGHKYEEIRRSLVKIFAWRKCSDPEGMADATINIVAQKVCTLRQTYKGDPYNYFYGVARNLIREYQKSKAAQVMLDDIDSKKTAVIDDTDDDDVEHVDGCLRECLDTLDPDERELVLAYYKNEGQAKIDLRRKLAQLRGIDTNALRQRIYRIRCLLADCMENCLQ
jgi:RNA polymerase sigma factor (sigma-70 family)